MPADQMARTLAQLGGQMPPPREYITGERLQEAQAEDFYSRAGGKTPNMIPGEPGLSHPMNLIQIAIGILFVIILLFLGYIAFKAFEPSVDYTEGETGYTPPRVKLPGTS